MNILLDGFGTVPGWVVLSALVFIALLAGAMLARVVIRLALWVAHKNTNKMDEMIVQRLRAPLYTLLPLLLSFVTIRIVQPSFMDGPIFSGITKVLSVVLVSWLAVRLIHIGSAFLTRRYDISAKDNLRARRMHTQISVLRRIASFLVFILALGSIFLLFEQLRGLGVSLLASAGVAGIIIGLAAQKALGNLLAGIQIAITQPIRLEDAVVVEGEWGWVEEITLTYVVVRIWDWRRLVLPISYFIENPFQNWTRTSANIIGAVVFYMDYSMPLDPVRQKLAEILDGNDLWDGQVQVVQLVDCEERTAKIRILVSAVDSPTAWDLRCYVREQIVAFIHDHYGYALPKTRAVFDDSEAFGHLKKA